MHNQTPLSVAVRKAIWLGLAPAAVVCSSAVFAQESPSELETITVTAQALKVDTPAQETPRSVSIVTEDDLRTRAPQKLDEALRYTSGVTAQPYGADNDTDWFRVRGFEAASYLDGSRLYRDGYYTWLLEPYGLESVEVVKGPSAILFGESSPGGVVNAVQKKPTYTPKGEVKVEVGNNSHQSIAFDISDLANEDGSARYRLVGMVKSVDGQLDGTENERFFLAPSLELDISDRTMLTLFATYLKDDGVPTNAFMPMEGTLINSDKGQLDPSLNLGAPDHDFYKREQISVGYALSHDLNQTWALAQKFNYGYNKLNLHSTYIWPFGDANDQYSRGIVYEDGVNQSITLDNNAVGTWYQDNTEHQLLTGFEVQYHNVDSQEQEPSTDSINPWAPGDAGFTPIDTANNIHRNIDKTQLSIYAQYQLSYLERWLASAGARYDWFDVSNTGVGPSTNEDERLKEGKVSFNAGLMYKADNGVSPYVSFAQGFEALSSIDWQTGKLYEPRESEQWELGLKYEPHFLDGFINVALFDIVNKNALSGSFDSPTQTQTGEQTSTGIELEVVGYVTESTKVSAAYTYTDTEITDERNSGDNYQAPLIPEQQATLWLDYDASYAGINGLNLGSGVRYIGESAVSPFATYSDATVDSATLWDIAVSYDINAQWQTQLNINNILDKEYVAGCDTYCYYGQSRSVVINANYRW